MSSSSSQSSLEDDPGWHSIRERVERGFDESTAATFGEQYFNALLISWREVNQSLRRTTLFLVVLIVGFVLLKDAKAAQFTLGPLRLTNVSAVLTLIPVLVGLLAYEFVALVAAQSTYRKVLGELLRVLHRSVYEHDLEYMLAPPTVMLFGNIGGTWESLRATAPRRSRAFLDRTGTGIAVTLLLGGPAFLIYAYAYLYSDRHANSFAVSLGLAVAVLFFARAAALMDDTEDQER